MWNCPECQQKFRNNYQSHSCGQGTVQSFLQGSSEISLSLYNHFIETYKKIGEFDLNPAKSRNVPATRLRFAEVNKLGRNYSDGQLVMLNDYSPSALFHRVDKFGNSFVNNFRLKELKDINAEYTGLMKIIFKDGKELSI